MSSNPTYVTWLRLTAQKKVPVTPRWKRPHGFQNFVKDMGLKPLQSVFTRRDMTKGFNPKNCLYIPRTQRQAFHATKHLAFGKKMTLRAWSVETKIPVYVLKARMAKKGVGLEEAISQGIPPKVKRRQNISPKEQTKVAFQNLRARLMNPKNPSYKNWGAQGYRLCERWLDFKNFLEDMGIRPPQTSICIKPGCKIFDKENCYYGTQAEVLKMTFRGQKFKHAGKTLSITEWSKELGLPFTMIYQRLVVLKWPVAKALSTE